MKSEMKRELGELIPLVTERVATSVLQVVRDAMAQAVEEQDALLETLRGENRALIGVQFAPPPGDVTEARLYQNCEEVGFHLFEMRAEISRLRDNRLKDELCGVSLTVLRDIVARAELADNQAQEPTSKALEMLCDLVGVKPGELLPRGKPPAPKVVDETQPYGALDLVGEMARDGIK